MSSKSLFVKGWEVTGISGAGKFFPVLVEILPLPAYLCFEGTSIAPSVRSFLASKAITPIMPISAGTIWPTPNVFHVRATEQTIGELAALATRHAEQEICDHFHAYSDTQRLLQWYDAFQLPLLIDESISETSLQQFCQILGARYSRCNKITS